MSWCGTPTPRCILPNGMGGTGWRLRRGGWHPLFWDRPLRPNGRSRTRAFCGHHKIGINSLASFAGWVIIGDAFEFRFAMLPTIPDMPPPSLPTDQQVAAIVSGLVHDVRQPLSVIEACADYLNLVLPETDQRSRRQLELLQRQVGEVSRILHDAMIKAQYGESSGAIAAADC